MVCWKLQQLAVMYYPLALLRARVHRIRIPHLFGYGSQFPFFAHILCSEWVSNSVGQYGTHFQKCDMVVIAAAVVATTTTRSTFGHVTEKEVYICVRDGGIHFYYYFAFRISRDTHNRNFDIIASVLVQLLSLFSYCIILTASHSSTPSSSVCGFFFHLLRRTAVHFSNCHPLWCHKMWARKNCRLRRKANWMAKMETFSFDFPRFFKIKYWRRWHFSPAECDDTAQPFLRCCGTHRKSKKYSNFIAGWICNG